MTSNKSAIGAIRLALEGGATDKTVVAAVRHIVAEAPETEPEATEPTVVFIRAIRALGGQITVVGSVDPPVRAPVGDAA